MSNKIIFITRIFNPQKWGGTETVIRHTARHLQKRGYSISLFTTKAVCKESHDQLDNIPIRRFHYFVPWFGLNPEQKAQLESKAGNLLSFSLLWALLVEKNVSLIHLHTANRIGAIGRFVAKIRRIPYVITLHGGYLTVPAEQSQQMIAPAKNKLEWGKLFGWLLGSRRVIEDADAILCVGQEEYDSIHTKYPAKKVYYTPNGVDIQAFQHVSGQLFREHYHIPPTTKLLLCVSRIDFQKNQIGLVDAFAEIHNAHPDTKLVIIGTVSVADYYQRLQQQITNLQLEDAVLVIPGLPPDDPLLMSAFQACDIFVFPTFHEPFGIVILEAWANRKPVVASGIGGILGFTTHNHNIIQVSPHSTSEIVSAVNRVLENPELAQSLGAHGFDTVKNGYDWQTITNQIEEIYQSVQRKHI